MAFLIQGDLGDKQDKDILKYELTNKRFVCGNRLKALRSLDWKVVR
jgi:hypothetical protein